MRITLTLLLLYITIGLSAQPGSGQAPPKASLSGTILEATTGQAIEYATIYLRHNRDTSFISGGITDEKGQFKIEQLRPGPYTIKVSFIGCLSYESTIAIRPPQFDMVLDPISLNPDAAALKEVTVTAEREAFQLAIDKKVFNVDKNSLTAGGSATDVLRQIPTVEVSIDGALSLRGSANLTVLINGKPSGLTGTSRQAVLDQLPANMIERVELITNPSAKYDAEGMAGIINIILKENKELGSYGYATAGTGSNSKYNASAGYTYNKGKWGLGFNLSARYNNTWKKLINLRDNFLYDTVSINQNSREVPQSFTPSFNGTVDYRPSQKTNFTFAYLFGYENTPSIETLNYEFLNAERDLTRANRRTNRQDKQGFNLDASIAYKQKFKKDGQELSALCGFSGNHNFNRSSFTQNYLDANYMALAANIQIQNTITRNQFFTQINQVDYTQKFKFGKLETGAKATLRYLDADIFADSFNYAIRGFEPDNRVINRFKFNEWVIAAYALFNGKIGTHWEYQAGIRGESTLLTTTQSIGNQTFNNNYTYPFPSASLLYHLNENLGIQAAYSRRLNRPNFRDLNPFRDISDPYNLRFGNPQLLPELTDAYEFNVLKTFSNGHTLTGTAYFRQVNNTIQRLRTLDSLGVTIIRMSNVSYAQNYGVELISRNRLFKWWTNTANFNFYQSKVFGSSSNSEATFSNSNLTWNLRLNSTFKLWKDASLQASYFYNGPSPTAQGRVKTMQWLDLGFRQDFDKHWSVSINLSDVFNTRQFAVESYGEGFSGSIIRKPESRIANLVLTYRFGKNDATPNENRRGKRGDGGGDNGGGGGGDY